MSEPFCAITLCDGNYSGHLPDAAVPIYYRQKLHGVSEVHVKNAVNTFSYDNYRHQLLLQILVPHEQYVAKLVKN